MINYINGQIIYGDLSKAKVILGCPFCNATPKIRKDEIRGYPGWFEVSIACPDCGGAAFTSYSSDERTVEEAYNEIFEKWNRRDGML